MLILNDYKNLCVPYVSVKEFRMSQVAAMQCYCGGDLETDLTDSVSTAMKGYASHPFRPLLVDQWIQL